MFSVLWFGGIALSLAGGASIGRTLARKKGLDITGIALCVAGALISYSAL